MFAFRDSGACKGDGVALSALLYVCAWQKITLKDMGFLENLHLYRTCWIIELETALANIALT